MGETNKAENAKARDLPPEVMADLQGLVDAMHDPGGIGEWASTSDSVEQRHAHTLARQVKATRAVTARSRRTSATTSNKNASKADVSAAPELAPPSAPASTFGAAVAKSAGTFAVAAAVAKPADVSLADSPPVRSVQFVKQPEQAAPEQEPEQAAPEREPDRPQDPEVEAWARWLVVNGFAGSSASGQSVSGGVIDVREGVEAGAVVEGTVEAKTETGTRRSRRERSEIRTLTAANAAPARSFDAPPAVTSEDASPGIQPLETALPDEDLLEAEPLGMKAPRPTVSIAKSKSASIAAATPLEGTGVARPLDDLVPGVLFGETDNRSLMPSQGVSSWLRYNWPFVLAGLFIVLGVILIVSVIMNG